MRSSTRLSPAGDAVWPRLVTLALVTIVVAPLVACNEPATPTSPSSTTTTTTSVAPPSSSQEFAGTLAVGGSSFYSFSVQENGTVNVTFTEIRGTGVPSTVWMGLGIGTPSAEDCATTTSLNTQSGSTPQLTGTYVPGVYCARIYDIGNLAASAQFSITIAHP